MPLRNALSTLWVCTCLVMASACNIEDNVDRGTSSPSNSSNTLQTNTSTSQTKVTMSDMNQEVQEDMSTIDEEDMLNVMQDMNTVAPVVCTKSADCSPTQYCLTAVGAGCDINSTQQGVCTPRPSSCPSGEQEAVCGCDDKSYPSLCAASLLGADVKTLGACPDACDDSECGAQVLTSPCLDGTRQQQFCRRPTRTADCKWEVQDCPEPVSCATKEDCRMDAICGRISSTARNCNKILDPTCYTPPQTCDKSLRPVCGCDGVTYSNPCRAVKAGVQIASEGPCKCISNKECKGSQYCKSSQPSICPSSKLEGSCSDIPLCISLPSSTGHVCGCDGKTYETSCNAQRAGVNVISSGVCPGDCLSDADCSGLRFCDFKDNDCGRDPKNAKRRIPGTCKSIPSPIPCKSSMLTTFCGCGDGKSYPTVCDANKNKTDARPRRSGELVCTLTK